jgi:tRNA-dihydrouridine synthase
MDPHRQAPRLILAPLKGFTDVVFRNTFAEHFDGFDGAMAPFVAAVAADRLTDKHVRDLLPHQNTRMPIEPQILGNTAEDFVFLARHLFELGYPDVNWNLGCPFRPVTKKRRGSGLLPFPEQVDEFLSKTLPAIPGRVSIKMRLGRTKPDEILRLLPVLNRYPLTEITIHPRTARQMYADSPNLEMFQVCLEQIRHRVVYNGDITDLQGFQTLAARFPSVHSWMIGRGALSNPFLPSIIRNGREGGGGGKVEKFKAFYEDLFARYQERLCGPGHLLNRMKGFWTYFACAFNDGQDFAKRIHRTFKLPQYLETVQCFFRGDAEWRGNDEGGGTEDRAPLSPPCR